MPVTKMKLSWKSTLKHAAKFVATWMIIGAIAATLICAVLWSLWIIFDALT